MAGNQVKEGEKERNTSQNQPGKRKRFPWVRRKRGGGKGSNFRGRERKGFSCWRRWGRGRKMEGDSKYSL